MRAGGRALALLLLSLALGGCENRQGNGYVEIRTVPVSTQAHAPLLFDADRLGPIRKGQAVLRAKVGAHKLQVEGPGGQPVLLCELLVRKDRMTTVTVSVLERPPRCACRNAASPDVAGSRICVS